MRVILKPRYRGKTQDLIEWALAAPEGEHRIVVSATRERSHQLHRNHHALTRQEQGLPFLESWQFVCFAELAGPGVWSGVLRGRGGHIVLGLDDLDHIIGNGTYGWPVGAVTLTQEEES